MAPHSTRLPEAMTVMLAGVSVAVPDLVFSRKNSNQSRAWLMREQVTSDAAGAVVVSYSGPRSAKHQYTPMWR
jgi:hypothetical protein